MNINTIVYDETKIDLFQTPELLSKTMQSLLDEFCDMIIVMSYVKLYLNVLSKVIHLNMVDCIPYNLNKII
jgi:hypothetical protein